jgi:hypothetical protein
MLLSLPLGLEQSYFLVIDVVNRHKRMYLNRLYHLLNNIILGLIFRFYPTIPMNAIMKVNFS